MSWMKSSVVDVPAVLDEVLSPKCEWDIAMGRKLLIVSEFKQKIIADW